MQTIRKTRKINHQIMGNHLCITIHMQTQTPQVHKTPQKNQVNRQKLKECQ